LFGVFVSVNKAEHAACDPIQSSDDGAISNQWEYAASSLKLARIASTPQWF
jgi:hypothetical protein